MALNIPMQWYILHIIIEFTKLIDRESTYLGGILFWIFLLQIWKRMMEPKCKWHQSKLRSTWLWASVTRSRKGCRSRPGGRGYTCPPPQVFGRFIKPIRAISTRRADNAQLITTRPSPHPTHGFPRALREILYSTSDPTTLHYKHVQYSEHTI